MKLEAKNPAKVTLVGHCFGSIGMCEHLREVHRAFRKVGVDAAIYNMYEANPTPQQQEEFGRALTDKLPAGIRIFHLNGDEIDLAYRTLEAREPGCFARGYNIIYPAWELPRYPAEWARELERFREVWAPSQFIRESVAPAVNIPVLHMPLACEPRVSRDLTRRYFKLPEDRFIVLFFWDALSYTARKNPGAVLDLFTRIIAERPLAPIQLVLKINNGGRDPVGLKRLKDAVAGFHERVSFIERTISEDEVRNLVRASDCFLSLHRSEGFGRGLAEAMYFGVPLIATGWSGNMDFMTAQTSLAVDYKLVPVQEGEYPHAAGQHWADPDIDEAKRHLLTLLDNPNKGLELGRAAGIRMRKHFSHRSQGVRYLTRTEKIGGSLSSPQTDDMASCAAE